MLSYLWSGSQHFWVQCSAIVGIIEYEFGEVIQLLPGPCIFNGNTTSWHILVLLNKDSEMSQISQNVEFVQVNIYLDRELIATEGWCVLEFKRCLDRSCKKKHTENNEVQWSGSRSPRAASYWSLVEHGEKWSVSLLLKTFLRPHLCPLSNTLAVC